MEMVPLSTLALMQAGGGGQVGRRLLCLLQKLPAACQSQLSPSAQKPTSSFPDLLLTLALGSPGPSPGQH